MQRAFFAGPRPLAFAHRGGAKLWPENTLVAFQGAIDLGFSFIETDVHLSRDGVVVIHHDARLDRTTSGSGRVRDHTLAELRRLDAGYHFSDDGRSYPFRDQGITIPTFEEALDLHPDVRFNVELKQQHPSMARAFWDIVERRGLHDRVLVAAADDAVGRDFDAVACGRVARSPGTRGVLAFWLAARTGLTQLLPLAYDALQVPVKHAGLTVVDRRFIEAAHSQDLQVHVWTVDDAAEMRRLIALGVDGLMTDRPDVLAEVVGLQRPAS